VARVNDKLADALPTEPAARTHRSRGERGRRLRQMRDRLSTALNGVLCEMKPGYDDSITGFNEAWDVMRKLFDAEIERAARYWIDLDGRHWADQDLADLERRYGKPITTLYDLEKATGGAS
jgi:hypothetical protein